MGTDLGSARIPGGGKMGERVRAFDWSTTLRGPIKDWPASQCTAASLVLTSHVPSVLLWGPELTFVAYNDAYRPILRSKPEALGRSVLDVWAEARDALAPQLARAWAGEAVSFRAARYTVLRGGEPEEAWFDYGFSPVYDEAGRVAGLFNTSIEVTARVLEDRRRTFRLGLDGALRDLHDPHETAVRAAEALGRHLGVACVGFAEIGPDGHVASLGEFHDGRCPDLPPGRHLLEGCGAALATATAAGRPVVVHDTQEDASTGVTSARASGAEVALRAFLMIPLAREGQRPACLYAAHPEPRRWSDEDVALVGETAERTWAAVGRAQAETALRESEARWRGLFERMHEGFCLCEMIHDAEGRGVNFRYLEVNAAWERLTGVPVAATLGRLADEVNQDMEPFWIETLARVVETGEAVHFEHRAAGMEGRWFEVHVYRTEPGRFAALFLNVTDRKRAEERQALLAREVDHRAKNALAVVQAMLRLTRAEDVPSYVRTVENRVAALARAQTLLAEGRWDGADLRTLVAGELAPFLSGRRAELDGPPMMLPSGMAQPLAMALHELATNAVKHGALAVPGGRVSVSWLIGSNGAAAGDAMRLRWEERGGPPVVGRPARRGFGSRVLEETIRKQLSGTVSFAWNAAGLVCDMEVPLPQEQGHRLGEADAEGWEEQRPA